MYYDNRYVEQNIGPLIDDSGNPLPEMTDADWNTFPVVPNGDLCHNWGDERTHLYSKNPSFLAAGGILVFGEPWKNDIENDSGIPRVYFGYRDYARFTEQLSEKIQNSGVQYDAVVTMPKGGVAIGAHIAKSLGKPLGYYHANSYGTRDEQGRMNMGSFQRPPYFPKKGRILLVDDLADTGATFTRIKSELESMGYTVDTAAIFHKDKPGVSVPTHCLFPKYPDVWIVQPTEGHLEKGSMTEGHKIGGIDKNKVTKHMEVIASEIRRICGEKRDIRFFLPPSVSMIQSMIAIGVARLLGPEYRVEFIPTEGKGLFAQETHYNHALGIAHREYSDGIEIMPNTFSNIPLIIVEIDDTQFGCIGGHDLRDIDRSNNKAFHKVWVTKQELDILSSNLDLSGGKKNENNRLMRAILDRAQRERNESEVEIPYVDKLSSEEYQQCLYYFFGLRRSFASLLNIRKGEKVYLTPSDSSNIRYCEAMWKLFQSHFPDHTFIVNANDQWQPRVGRWKEVVKGDQKIWTQDTVNGIMIYL